MNVRESGPVRPAAPAGPWGPYAAGPSPALRSAIAFVLRVSLGLGLLNVGLLTYMANRTGAIPGMRGMGGMPATPVVPGNLGMMDVSQVVPYLQIAIGLALVLGFFTTYAAVAAGLVSLLDPAAMTVSLLASGMPVRGPSMFGMNYFGTWGAESTRLLLVAAVAWMAASGHNPLSIDTLVFGRGAASRPPGPLPPGAFVDDPPLTAGAGPAEGSPRPGTSA